MHFNINLAADAAELQQAEEAIRIQKEYNETIHLHIQQQHQQQMVAAATLQTWQRQLAPGAAAGPVSAAASPVAGVIQAAAAAGGGAGMPAGSAAAAASSPKSRPTGVPRLELGSLSGSEGTQQQQQQHSGHAGAGGSGSSRVPVGFLTDSQRTALLGRLPGNMDSLVGSPRLAGSTARPATQPQYSARQHGAQQPATARSVRGAAAKYAGLCSSARNTAAAAASSPAGEATGNSTAAAAITAAAAAAAAPTARLAVAQQPLSSTRRPYSASTGHHIVQPQPSRDEWRAVAASCLTQRHAGKCRSVAKPAAAGEKGGKQVCASAGAGASAVLPALHSQAGAAAAGQTAPALGFAVRKWEQASANTASTARRTYRAGAAAQASAAAVAAAAGGTGYKVASTQRGVHAIASSSSRSPYLQHKAAAGGLQHTALPTGAVSSEQHAAAEPPPLAAPSNNDKQLGTPRTARQAKALSLGAGCTGAVNSPRAARQAAVVVAAAAGSGTSHRAAASSPRPMPDWQLISTAMSGGASVRGVTPCDKAQSPGRTDRQSNGSNGSSCADSAAQFDTNRSGKGKTPRQEAALKGSGRQLGSVLDASCKYLLSACAVPPAALLSPRYVGPVEAAVMRAQTPRDRQ